MRKSSFFGSGNPLMSEKSFSHQSYGSAMTVGGTIAKAAFALIILAGCAAAAWTYNLDAVMPFALIGGIILAIVTIFNKPLAPYTVPAYAALEGIVLGSISHMFERSYPGIVNQAVLATFGVLGVMLVLYQTGLLRPTERFRSVIMAATMGIGAIYMLNMIMMLFGSSITLIHDISLFGIGFSLFVAVIAALNLILDFEMIETGSRSGAPKYMEWYAAFGLLVTLIWLYLEILRLISKLQRRK